MNCREAGDMLMDLLDGELDAASREQLVAHLASCPACEGEYAALRRARSAIGLLAEQAPPMRVPILSDEPVGRVRPTDRRRAWRVVATAAAAAFAAALTLFLLQERTIPTAVAGPVEITRTGVSLTILSRPPEWDRYGQFPAGQQAAQVQMPGLPGQGTQRRQTQIDGQWGEQVTLPGLFTYMHEWPGLALVRDQRVIRNVRQGEAEVRFADVPAGIWPDSVRLRCLDREPPLKILEQNYQYDLASAAAVLSKHIDKTITVLFEDGRSVSGTLLSFDGGTLVIQPPGEGPRNIARREVAAVTFEKLPQGLLTTPTLLWQLANPAPQTQRQFEVAYLTTGLFWRADYVLRLHPAESKPKPTTRPGPQSEIRNQKSEIVDSADLVGYATVVNNSGVTFQDAQLKLMAGDVNLLIRPYRLDEVDSYRKWAGPEDGPRREQMVEKSFFEYHLYTLTRPTTIANNETKQLEMVSGAGLALRRGYVYDPDENATAARVVSEMENTEANGLGKPLPKGVVRLYAPDPEGVSTYVSQTEIDHTPVKEKLRLPWGHAFDIACSRRETDAIHAGNDHHLTVEYSLRNHKDRDVTVTVIIRVPASTYAATCVLPWHVREVGVVEVTADVPAGKETMFTFDYRFNDVSGGGLKSPHDQARPRKP